MSDTTSPFVRRLLANLRLSAIIVVVGIAAVALFGVIAQEPIEWQIPVFLAIGMLLSSLINAAVDTRRDDGDGGSR